MKIFLTSINSPIGHTIYEELRNDDVESENYHKFFTTIDNSDDTLKPEGHYEIISVKII